MANTLTAEIFAVGKWNGMTFQRADLDAIVKAFSRFRDLLKVPLKLGHNDEQPLTDGMPALGWVDDVWIEGQKLMGRFADVPDIVFNAIKTKRYRKVSCELDMDVDFKGEKHPLVLTAVALLGADIPAVSTLSDLTAYMSRGSELRAGRRAAFASIAGDIPTPSSGDPDIMSNEQITALTQQVATLTAEVAKQTTANAELTRKNAELEGQVAHFTAEKKAAEETARKAQLSTKRADAVKLLDDAVKANSITPAQRTAFTRTLGIDDDTRLQALDLEDVKGLVGAKSAAFSQTGRGAGHSAADPDTGKSADEIVVERVNEAIAKGEAKDFAAAKTLVLSRDRELANRYINRFEEA